MNSYGIERRSTETRTEIYAFHDLVTMLQYLRDSFREFLVLPFLILPYRANLSLGLHAQNVRTHLVKLGTFRCLGDDAVDLRLVLRKPMNT